MAEGANQILAGADVNGEHTPATTEPATQPMAPVTPPAAPIVDVATDRCASCGADLAVDQRYCVECGQRRGKPRYTLAPPAAEPVVTTAPAPQRSGGRFSPGVALLTGLATLLLALGVGVLIGHSGSNASGRQPVNVTVGAGGGGSAPAGSAAAAAGSAGQKSSSGGRTKSGGSGKSAAHATTHKPLPPAARKVAAPKPLKKAAAVASKHVTSTTGQNSIGSKCSSGPGCHNGKQTGVFFGGG